MAGDGRDRIMPATWTVIFVVAALYFARPILAPVAFSLLVIAIVWPLQKALRRRMPNIIALALVLCTTLVTITVFGSLIVWGFSITSQWLFNNAARFQILYVQAADWLEQHEIFVAASIAERFNAMWLIGIVANVAGRLNSTAGFFALVLIFTIMGLLEVGDFQQRLASLDNQQKRRLLLQAGEATAIKLRRYMLVRTAASMLTGVLTYGVAVSANLELAAAWGVIAFALNYIPFIGSAIATVLPALFALIQFQSWRMAVIVLVGLGAVQFLTGNYLEPRLSGRFVDISPYAVLFAVFFWSFLWGIPGAFLGVPMTIAIVTACDHVPSTRWLAVLMSGRPPRLKSTRIVGG